MSNILVSVQCPCGESFDRSGGRGRPAIWCPECRKVPVAQRIARPVGEDGVTAENKVSRFGQHDPLTFDQREAVEAAVIEVNERRSALSAKDIEAMFPDADPRDIPFLLGDWQRQQYEEAYSVAR